jgi:hypothetical protein
MTEHTAEKAHTLLGALGALRSLNLRDLDYELRKYQGIRDWAIRSLNLGYDVGDRVQIISPVPGRSEDGWKAYAECLRVGATGVVSRIEFNLHHGSWDAMFTPDVEWATSDYMGGKRWWHGPVDATPEGYEPPSDRDAERHPLGRRHTFAFRVDWLAPVVTPPAKAGGE